MSHDSGLMASSDEAHDPLPEEISAARVAADRLDALEDKEHWLIAQDRRLLANFYLKHLGYFFVMSGGKLVSASDEAWEQCWDDWRQSGVIAITAITRLASNRMALDSLIRASRRLRAYADAA